MAIDYGEWWRGTIKDDINHALDKVFHKRRKEDSVVTHITVGNVLEDKEVFPTSKHIDIATDMDRNLADMAVLGSVRKPVKYKIRRHIVIDTQLQEPSEYISQTNTSELDISNMNTDDKKESISNNIDVGFGLPKAIVEKTRHERELLRATTILSNLPIAKARRKAERDNKPRFIYYQNGECQRTLI